MISIRLDRYGTTLGVGCAIFGGLAWAAAVVQRTDAFVDSRDHPAIAYSTSPERDTVATLNKRLDAGTTQFVADRESGYLRAALLALGIQIESQVLVFSQTSNQADQIGPTNPRAIYFNDTAAVGWVRGSPTLEIAVQDPQQGVVFYTLDQSPSERPRFKRQQGCLLCHLSWETLGVPGVMVLSTFQMSDDPNAYAGGFVSDHRSPLNERWGGWYVTGKIPSVQHRGNVPVIVSAEALKQKRTPAPQLDSVAGRFDTRGYPTACSDVAALMVLEHQTRMTNLITRLGWETRVALYGRTGPLPPRVEQAARDLVDYMLFVDEALLPGRIQSSCGFAARFTSGAVRDGKGRTLRELDLGSRLMKYPCSFMIHTPAFDALPPAAKERVYRRMWEILSGNDRATRYAHLSLADRQAITEILRQTKTDLPGYFVEVVR